ncbi:MAG: ribosome-associated translation inhibitor RaiA [Gammaproteobacteria bacterium]|nr:ribosome-associated translation inhibitor RaiA [Gammaproteobacteria bacterium]
MDVKLHGKNYQFDERLAEAARAKVSKAARFFNGISSADVEIVKEMNRRVTDPFRVEITSRAAGSTVRVEAAGPTAEAALDIATEKFGIQLRRLKERLIDRSRRGREKRLNTASKDDEEEPSGPLIVRVKQFVMKPMTPEEAALQMEMLGHGFFFFQNAEGDRPSVLYRRRDGSYGLIEPA